MDSNLIFAGILAALVTRQEMEFPTIAQELEVIAMKAKEAGANQDGKGFMDF